MSRFLPVIVLIPKSVVHDKAAQNKPVTNKSVVCLKATSDIPSPLRRPGSRIRAPRHVVFGEMTVCFPTMETHRKGQLVALTCKEFKTLAYLIKNAEK
jgi:hypothetical protein